MSAKDSGSSLIRRRSTRRSIRAQHDQDRKLSIKETPVWTTMHYYATNPPLEPSWLSVLKLKEWEEQHIFLSSF